MTNFASATQTMPDPYRGRRINAAHDRMVAALALSEDELTLEEEMRIFATVAVNMVDEALEQQPTIATLPVDNKYDRRELVQRLIGFVAPKDIPTVAASLMTFINDGKV